MILKTNKVVVGHVFERSVYKFPCDDWFVNYITYTVHFIMPRCGRSHEAYSSLFVCVCVCVCVCGCPGGSTGRVLGL